MDFVWAVVITAALIGAILWMNRREVKSDLGERYSQGEVTVWDYRLMSLKERDLTLRIVCTKPFGGNTYNCIVDAYLVDGDVAEKVDWFGPMEVINALGLDCHGPAALFIADELQVQIVGEPKYRGHCVDEVKPCCNLVQGIESVDPYCVQEKHDWRYGVTTTATITPQGEYQLKIAYPPLIAASALRFMYKMVMPKIGFSSIMSGGVVTVSGVEPYRVNAIVRELADGASAEVVFSLGD